MLVEVRSNKTVKYSNVQAVCSYLLGCQSILVQELSSSSQKALWQYTVKVLYIMNSFNPYYEQNEIVNSVQNKFLVSNVIL